MAIEDWIDNLTRVWEIDDHKGGTVRSFRLHEKNEFPDTIPTGKPCAITFPQEVECIYSLGGPLIDHWAGITEFHLFNDTSKDKYPALIAYINRIKVAAAANIQLSETVEEFLLVTGGVPSIQVQTFKYGDEAPHWGLLVHWFVKDNTSGDFTPSA